MERHLTKRIAYYTKKVAERISYHPAKVLPAKYIYRNKRLTLYKKLMHQLIEKEGDLK